MQEEARVYEEEAAELLEKMLQGRLTLKYMYSILEIYRVTT